MKKILLISLLFLITFLFFYINFSKKDSKGNVIILSPIPFQTREVLSAEEKRNFWKPNIDSVYESGIKKPYVTAISAVSYDLSDNKLLYEKNIKSRYPIASLTKITTAIVALENEKLDKNIKISKEAATIGENSMFLTEGEELSLKDLLYGLVLLSANDAAEAIAIESEMGRDNFLYLMNKKAEDLGLTDTHFTNPTGLEGDGNQYGSAYDLLVLTEYALRNKDFADIVSTVTHDIPYSDKHKSYNIFNETNLLTSYPGVKGVKTGFTNEAGYCLVTYLEYEGHKIIAVLLNSQSRREEMKELLDYSLKTLGVKPPPHQ